MSKCNLNCVYCFEKKTNDRGENIGLEEIKLIYKKLRYYLSHAGKGQKLTIEWTGGEPLLLGYDYFKKALSLQQRYFNGNLKNHIHNGIQTNATLLNDNFIKLFKKYRVGLGISWDIVGNARLMGKRNVNVLVLEKIKKLITEGVKFGVIVVVTNENVRLMKAIYKTLRDANIDFHFNYLNKGDTIFNTALQPPINVLARNSIKMAKLYLDDKHHKRTGITVSNILEDIKLAKYNKINNASLCAYQKDCFKYFISVEPDGAVYPCPTFKSDISYLGNIYKQSMNSLVNHPFKSVLKRRRRQLLRVDCKGCKWRYGCNGGCPAEAYCSNGLMKRTVFSCSLRKQILPQLQRYV